MRAVVVVVVAGESRVGWLLVDGVGLRSLLICRLGGLLALVLLDIAWVVRVTIGCTCEAGTVERG